jgi:hypothetical protein
MLPGDYAFTAADAGRHVFRATLKTVGAQSLTATDQALPYLRSTQAGIQVRPAAASRFTLTSYPSPSVAGAGGVVTLTAFDAYGNLATGYTGTVHLSSTDPQAYVDSDHTFTAADAGQFAFYAVLVTTGTWSITAADTATSALSVTQAGLVVTPAAAAFFAVGGFPSPTTAGQPGTFTVTAYDAYGNVATGYTGTVTFTSSDAQAVLPADYTFAAADQGQQTFTATLNTPGLQSLTATDAAAGVSGTQDNIQVF